MQSPSLRKLVREVIQHLGRDRQFARRTLDNIELAHSQFQYWLQAHDHPDTLDAFDGDNVREWAQDLIERGVAKSTICHRLSCLSSIARTLMKMKDSRGRFYAVADPTKTFDWPLVETPETQFLYPDELAKFLAVPRDRREAVARDLFIDTGLRVSALANACVGDVLLVGGKMVLTVIMKGRGRRLSKLSVPVSQKVANGLIQYLMERGIANPQDAAYAAEPLLLNTRGGRYTRVALSQLMTRIGREAGISRFRVSAHKLRHTANVVARVAGLQPLVRSNLLGHRSPRSLDRYDHVVPGELAQAREIHAAALHAYIQPATED